MRNKAIVIGSGIAGIATSIRLAQKGYEVQGF
jgi:phytoene dehydrogenase-like protein